MNTLRDTAEGKARPSVWPVYVVAVVVLVVSAGLVLVDGDVVLTALLTAEGLEELWADAGFLGLFLAGFA